MAAGVQGVSPGMVSSGRAVLSERTVPTSVHLARLGRIKFQMAECFDTQQRRRCGLRVTLCVLNRPEHRSRPHKRVVRGLG